MLGQEVRRQLDVGVDDRGSFVTRVVAGECEQGIVPVNATEGREKVGKLTHHLRITEGAAVGKIYNPVVQVPRRLCDWQRP